MRNTLLIIACMLVIAQPTSAQSTQLAQRGVPGIIDPVTGSFHATGVRAGTAASAATITGKIVVNISISVVSAVPATAPILCQASVSVSDAATFLTSYESTSVPAVRRGASAACTAVIPYAWTLGAPALDSIGISYSLSSTSAALMRESVVGAAAIHVPGNGATTTENIKAVL